MCTCSRIWMFFFFFITFANNGKLKALLCFYMCYRSINTRPVSCPGHTLEDTHTHAQTRLPHDTMRCDWQIDWPTDCGCGTTWQVEIGKWEAHFSLPSAEQKIKAFSSTKAIGRGGAQRVQVVE